jgi:type-F conjugative transfer system pilin assembly protein TrbC
MKKLFIFGMLIINFNVNATSQDEIQTSSLRHKNNFFGNDLSFSIKNNLNLINDIKNQCTSCKEEAGTLLDDFGVDPVKSSIIQKITSMNRSNKLNEKEKIVYGPNNFYVFVSWSMPLSSLKMLAQEAGNQKAILVFRGLKEDSFIKTAGQFKELGEGAIIDPLLFRENNISSVPTFVKSAKNCSVSLKGNVTLSFANKKLEEKLLIEQKKIKSNTFLKDESQGVKK